MSKCFLLDFFSRTQISRNSVRERSHKRGKQQGVQISRATVKKEKKKKNRIFFTSDMLLFTVKIFF